MSADKVEFQALAKGDRFKTEERSTRVFEKIGDYHGTIVQGDPKYHHRSIVFNFGTLAEVVRQK